MIRTAIANFSDALEREGHAGPIKLRLPPSAFEALMQEFGVDVPVELARGSRRTVRLGSVEVVE